MADVVTRLVVDSKEYDSKIQRAVAGLTQYEKKCREVGGTLEYVEKEDLDFVKALGQMETVSSSATGKLSELKKAFTELSVQYKNLTAAEKQSPYGKALSNSLEELKGRYSELKGQLKETNQDLDGNGDLFGELASKIGISSKMLSGFGVALASVTAALKVIGDALKSNELMFDEWGRITKSSSSIYEGFLYSLNNGDIGGFLDNIDNIVIAAREAYNALDALGTFNAFNQINMERARTQFTQALADYRSGTVSRDEAKAAGEALKKELQQRVIFERKVYKSAIRDLATNRNVDYDLLRAALSGDYGSYEELKKMPLTGQQEIMYKDPIFGTETGTGQYIRVAASKEEELGEMLRQLNDTELANIQALGAQAQRTSTEMAQIDRQMVRFLGTGKGKGSIPASGTATTASAMEGIIPTALVGSIGDWEQQAATVREYMKSATSTDEYKELEEELAFITSQIRELKGEKDVAFAPGSLNELNQQLHEAQAILANTTPDTEEWARALQTVSEKKESLRELQKVINGVAGETKKAGETSVDVFSKLSEGVNAVSSIVGSMERMASAGEKLAAVFKGDMDAVDSLFAILDAGIGTLQTTMTLYEGINTLISLGTELKAARATIDASSAATAAGAAATEIAAEESVAAASATAAGAKAGEAAAGAGESVSGIPIVGPVLAVAAIATVLAAVLGAMKSAKSAGKFASGGIIPGNNFNDGLVAYVSSGELILNRAQQDSIAGQLNTNPLGNLRLSAYVSGSDLRLVINNDNRARGGSRGYYLNLH